MVSQLTRGGGDEIPSPRLYDVVGEPLASAIVVGWCPVNLEQWWLDRLREDDAFGRLMATMAESPVLVESYRTLMAGVQNHQFDESVSYAGHTHYYLY